MYLSLYLISPSVSKQLTSICWPLTMHTDLWSCKSFGSLQANSTRSVRKSTVAGDLLQEQQTSRTVRAVSIRLHVCWLWLKDTQRSLLCWHLAHVYSRREAFAESPAEISRRQYLPVITQCQRKTARIWLIVLDVYPCNNRNKSIPAIIICSIYL